MAKSKKESKPEVIDFGVKPAPPVDTRRKKSKVGRTRRALKAKEPQVIEGPKRCLLLKGLNSSETTNDFLKDMSKLLKPFAKSLQKKNPIQPFDDATSLEFLCEKNDAATFIMCSHNKKRPNNIFMGRIFNNTVLDMIEFGLDRFAGIDDLEGERSMLGSKPCMQFIGDVFETSEEHKKMKSLVLDVFRGRDVSQVELSTLDRVITVFGLPDRLVFRTHKMKFMKSGTKVPRVVLADQGPHFDMVIRRTKFAEIGDWKAAMRQPKVIQAKKKKNVSKDAFGETVGRIHMEKQDYAKLVLHRPRALKKRHSERNGNEAKRQRVEEEGEEE